MIDSALQVLEEAITARGLPRTPAVRAALKTTAATCTDQSGLRWYWYAAGGTEPIGRRQNMQAALNRIHLILDGWHDDGSGSGLLRPPRRPVRGPQADSRAPR